MAHILVDTPAKVTAMIDDIVDLPVSPPSLYADIEGIQLGRNGSISIIELLAFPTNTVYLIDVYMLGDSAFTTVGTEGRTFQSILESPTIPKVFFDLRNDSDALFSLFGVKLARIEDIQLMEVATRRGYKDRVNGLARCIANDVGMDPEEAAAWKANKDKGRALFVPQKGGTYQVFNERPILPQIIDYCVQDVLLLPKLWEVYNNRIGTMKEPNPADIPDGVSTTTTTTTWRELIAKETEDRILLSQSVDYDPENGEKTVAPWPWHWAEPEIVDFPYTLDDPSVPTTPTDPVNYEYDPDLTDYWAREAEYLKECAEEKWTTPPPRSGASWDKRDEDESGGGVAASSSSAPAPKKEEEEGEGRSWGDSEWKGWPDPYVNAGGAGGENVEGSKAQDDDGNDGESTPTATNGLVQRAWSRLSRSASKKLGLGSKRFEKRG